VIQVLCSKEANEIQSLRAAYKKGKLEILLNKYTSNLI